MDTEGFIQTVRSLWVVWLILAFAAVVWWAYRPKNKKRFEDAGRIPFKDEDGGNDGR